MLVGLSFGVILGFSALAVDIGMIQVADTQLQAAIDAAALSGASELDGSNTGVLRARLRARQVASLNPMLDSTLDVPLTDVEVGTHDGDTNTFTVWDGVDPKVVNAVRVDHTPPQIGSALGAVAFGMTSYHVTARAMATRPTGAGTATSTECFLPLAIPDCWVTSTPPGENPKPLMFTFNPSPTDGVAWGDPDGNPSSDEVKQQLQGQCDQGEIENGDPIYVNEGAHTTALQTVRDILNNMTPVAPTVWDESLYGTIPPRSGTPDTANKPPGSPGPGPKSSVAPANWRNTLEGPVALVDAGSDCNNVSFTGTVEMTGVAWAVIYDVANAADPKNLYIQLDLINEHEIWGDVEYDTEGTGVLGTGDPGLVTW